MKKDFMRCHACGHGTDIKPDEPFIILQFKTIGEEIFQNVFVEEKDNRTSVTLYACPKCGTVKIEV